MFRILFLVAVIFCIGLTSAVYAQDVSQRTRDLVAALDKTKYKKKEKRNISIEVYVDIKNEPALKSPTEYSGLYESEDHSYQLNLSVSANGAAAGSGYDTANFDNGQKVNFTLKDARVEGALLTATKIFDNGTSERFEAAFVNRTVSAGQNPNSISTHDTSYGLGFIQGGTDKNANWTNRVFLEFKR
jgi:hypothetical protein